MAVQKLAVSMPEELAEAVRADARKRGESMSGWLAEAAARRLRRQRAMTLLAAYEAEHGAITETEMREVRRRWRG